MKKNNLKERIITSFILIFFIFLIFNSLYLMTLSLLIFGILSILEFFNLTKKIFDKKIKYFLSNLFFIIFISIFSFFFFILYNSYQSKFILFLLLIGCVASDIGGYIVGKIFKGPKLIKISPNKTFSGAIGSFIFSCTLFSSLIYYEIKVFSLKIVIIGLLISLFCQIGDLFFSYLKRKANIKDTGNLLPGHGGLLDRLDGIFFGIPLGFTALILLF